MRAAAALVLGFAAYVASAEPVTVGLDVSPPEVRPGQSATITWNAQSAKACDASGGWSGKKYVNGQETVTPKAVGTISYTITCDGVAQSKLLNVSADAGASTPAPAGQSAAAATEEAASPAASAPAAESSAAPLPDAPIPKSAIPVVKVSGNKLVDGNGNTLQLRGVDVSALEFYPISNAGGDYWGGQRPNMKAIRA